ncbi:tetratricopeptide repeat protein [Szabonella alba]|uniref:Tetratricopeptide repeat protein n=1 Tax=Szabonella alba TaxID=2804194 RepID=A0A8K0V6J2_9RHOB|nr:tetratricopeptide repeat protein [Szabonella alba]MBL4916298.1 tetratricopeptide repeat protein [Szabonella alba]
MKAPRLFLNRIVAAFVAIFIAVSGLSAQEADLDRLFAELPGAEGRSLQRIERQIFAEWSKSGSATADLLLTRGRDALREGETTLAIEHLTALVDHAPDFAEGWNARATAYFQAGQYGPAVADIVQVLRLNPRHFGAMTGFARILEESGRETQALALYDAALAIHPRLDGVREAADRLRVKATGQDL